jgi:hypothetical protein
MDFIDSYKDLFGTRRFVSRQRLRPGAVVQFTYDSEQKYAVVLNPNWQGKMHALSLNNLSPEQLKMLLGELDNLQSEEEVYGKYKASTYTENRPYRTYTIEKMSAIREIFLKENKK